MKRSAMFFSLWATGLLSTLALPTAAQELNLSDSVTLFKNIMVFDGTTDELRDVNVLVVRNRIHRIAEDIPEAGTWKIEEATGAATRLANPLGGLKGYVFTIQTERGTETKEVQVNVVGESKDLFDLIDQEIA